jgi:hypothetical protein
VPVGPISRGSVSLLFALIKDEPIEPVGARGDSKGGAPSTRRPCHSGQGNIRAHPPIEPMRDQCPHRQGVVDSFTWPREPPPGDEDVKRAEARTRCHLAAAHRGCRRGGGQGRRRPPVGRGARRYSGPRAATPRPVAAAGEGSRPRPESAASYILETDQDTKAAFSLLMEIARLELTGKTGSSPVLTLPLRGGR